MTKEKMPLNNPFRSAIIYKLAAMLGIGLSALTSCTKLMATTGPTAPVVSSAPNTPGSAGQSASHAPTPTAEKGQMILEIPATPVNQSNPSRTPVIIEYKQEIIQPGDEFILDPSLVNSQFKQAVGQLKLKLIGTANGKVTVSVLADQGMDGNFHPRKTIETLDLFSSSCIRGYPLVMDVFYQYCFDIRQDGDKLYMRYLIIEESTMPSP